MKIYQFILIIVTYTELFRNNLFQIHLATYFKQFMNII